MFRKIFYGISLLALLVIAGGYGFLRTKLPQRSGEIKLSGLKSKVDVVFDKWGIPHIEAANEQDAYHALGYLNAQDRIFQLELMDRVAHGRLSEMLGEATLDVDRYFRTLGASSALPKNMLQNISGIILQKFKKPLKPTFPV